MSMTERKYLIWSDIHFGYDKTVTRSGRIRRKPIHSIEALNCAFDFMESFKPDIFILMGDQFDMKSISYHERSRRINTENLRLKEEYDEFSKTILDPIWQLQETGVENHWFDGNHDAWINALVQDNPGLEGLVEPYRYLDITDKRGFKYHPRGHIERIGKVGFSHGDVILGKTRANPARKAVMEYGSSIRIGHLHTNDVFTKKVIKDNDYITGMVVPCLCNRAPKYQGPSPINEWVHGWNAGVLNKRNYFWDSNYLIHKGECYTVDSDGQVKTYGKNKKIFTKRDDKGFV